MDKLYTVAEASEILGITKVQVTIHLKNKGKGEETIGFNVCFDVQIESNLSNE